MVLNKYYLGTGALKCGHCGNESQNILVDETNPSHVKAVCANCRQYIKFLSKAEQGRLTPPLGTYKNTGAPTTNINVDVHVNAGANAGVPKPATTVYTVEENETRETRESLEELLALGVLSERYETVIKEAISIIMKQEKLEEQGV